MASMGYLVWRLMSWADPENLRWGEPPVAIAKVAAAHASEQCVMCWLESPLMLLWSHPDKTLTLWGNKKRNCRWYFLARCCWNQVYIIFPQVCHGGDVFNINFIKMNNMWSVLLTDLSPISTPFYVFKRARCSYLQHQFLRWSDDNKHGWNQLQHHLPCKNNSNAIS